MRRKRPLAWPHVHPMALAMSNQAPSFFLERCLCHSYDFVWCCLRHTHTPVPLVFFGPMNVFNWRCLCHTCFFLWHYSRHPYLAVPPGVFDAPNRAVPAFPLPSLLVHGVPTP